MLESVINIPTTHKQHNYSIDFIKGVACIFVVFIHCKFPGYLGTSVNAVSRFSVPFFFMVSGYFSYSSGKFDAKRKIKHIGKITFFASLFYLLVAVVKNHCSVSSILEACSLMGVLKLLLFNETIIFALHLWFLFALLYDYILYADCTF
ncbi:MAG: acyltransferase family protein [Victivallales bacterium]|nr:acyltransferase family protein [Victivallales bacterium]